VSSNLSKVSEKESIYTGFLDVLKHSVRMEVVVRTTALTISGEERRLKRCGELRSYVAIEGKGFSGGLSWLGTGVGRTGGLSELDGRKRRWENTDGWMAGVKRG
jgi:hypothetical protein